MNNATALSARLDLLAAAVAAIAAALPAAAAHTAAEALREHASDLTVRRLPAAADEALAADRARLVAALTRA